MAVEKRVCDMDVIGKNYFYETKAGAIKNAKLTRTTKAWYVFDNGDWIERYTPLFETEEELLAVNEIVRAIYDATPVPDVINFETVMKM